MNKPYLIEQAERAEERAIKYASQGEAFIAAATWAAAREMRARVAAAHNKGA